MANSIVLAWTVDVAGTPYGPAQAAAALGGVPLYDNPLTDPVLGQLFGLTVESDVTGPSGPSTVTRTLTLKMTPEESPPPFPCHPRTSTPPQLPYPLRRAVPLTGSFHVADGSAIVATTMPMTAELVPGEMVQFLSQIGVFYGVLLVSPTTITLTAPYTGRPSNTKAFKEVPAPVTLAAIYSTSPLDTDAVATSPAIPPGPGAQTIELDYRDSTGALFSVDVPITGRRPAEITLDPGSVDIAEIVEFGVDGTGSFDNSVGQITLCSLKSPLPLIPPDATPKDFRGKLTDAAQLLIDEHLAYLPPSYFALASQGASTPALEGDFFVTTGAKDVQASDDQTAALIPGDIIEFAVQRGTLYTVAAVTPKLVTLTTPYTGFDRGPTPNSLMPVGGQATDVKGASVKNERTAASKVSPTTAAPPSNDALAATLAQFVQTATAAPPPNPPFPPATIPTPTFLSGLFTQALQLALAVPVLPEPISLI